jgi:hypothetical protein
MRVHRSDCALACLSVGIGIGAAMKRAPRRTRAEIAAYLYELLDGTRALC